MSVTYHTALSKPDGLTAAEPSVPHVYTEVYPPSHCQSPWGRPVQGLRAVGFQGFRWVQFPVLLLRRSFWGLILGLNWWDIIDDQVLLGGALMFDDLERLRRQGVSAVVNLCAERPDNPRRLRRTQMDYLWLPVADTQAPTVAQICRGLAWLEQRLDTGRKVYIHCAAGMGRSVTLLACWYLYAGPMNLPQVLAFVKRRRPQTSLTRWQVRRIEEIAALLGTTAGKLPLDS